MLTDQNTAAVHQLDRAFFFSFLIIPGTGEDDVHGDFRNDGTNAEEEGRVAGNDLCIGERADVADLELVFGDLAVVKHLLELHARRDARKITAFINRRKRIVVVREILGVCLGAGCMAELNVREFLRRLDHEVLMTEAVRENDLAAGVRHVCCGLVALFALGDVGLDDVVALRNAERRARALCRIDEVQVVGGVFVMQADKADLDVQPCFGLSLRFILRLGLSLRFCGRRLFLRLAGKQGRDHQQAKNDSKKSLHVSLRNLFCIAVFEHISVLQPSNLYKKNLPNIL